MGASLLLNVTALVARMWGRASATSAECCSLSSQRTKLLPKYQAVMCSSCALETYLILPTTVRLPSRFLCACLGGIMRACRGFPRAFGPCAAGWICADVQDMPGLSGHPCARCQASENPRADEPVPPAPAQPEFWWEKRPWLGQSSTLALPPLLFPCGCNSWQRGRAAGKGSNILSQSSCSHQS